MDTLKETLSSLTVDKLKSYLRLFLPDEPGGSKKADLVQRIEKGLAGDKLRSQYELLDQWQQLAVAETLYAPDGQFHASEFQAKYGHSPTLSHHTESSSFYSSYSSEPARIRLFLYTSDKYAGYGLMIPEDLRTRLQVFVAEPAPASLKSLIDLPEHTEKGIPLTVRYMEQEALLDLPKLLNLVEQGKVQVGEKTGRGSAATLRMLTDHLTNGDFYVSKPKKHSWDQEIGAIKAFSWPLLLQAAKLAQINGKKLGLTKAGVGQLSKPSADSLRLIWQRWQKSAFDEFKRIDDIKGQNAKGRVMTAVAPRRAAIEEILHECPVGEWIKVDDFSNFMQARRSHFEITHNPFKLYIGDANYGNLGYAGCHDWPMLQGRYLLCLLFEYGATLGLVDVAYIDPEHARSDYRDLDDLNFLSRYDGLMYFRLTPLGAYCLGLTDNYQPTKTVSRCSFRILPGLQVNVVSGQPSPEDVLLLETWAVKETESSWRLDKPKAIDAIEKGHDMDNLQTFLQGHDDQPLPETVEGFLGLCHKQGRALRTVGTALLIDCSSEEVAKSLAEHQETAKLCQRVGKKQLLVRIEKEEKFRQAIRIVGFGMCL